MRIGEPTILNVKETLLQASTGIPVPVDNNPANTTDNPKGDAPSGGGPLNNNNPVAGFYLGRGEPNDTRPREGEVDLLPGTPDEQLEPWQLSSGEDLSRVVEEHVYRFHEFIDISYYHELIDIAYYFNAAFSQAESFRQLPADGRMRWIGWALEDFQFSGEPEKEVVKKVLKFLFDPRGLHFEIKEEDEEFASEASLELDEGPTGSNSADSSSGETICSVPDNILTDFNKEGKWGNNVFFNKEGGWDDNALKDYTTHSPEQVEEKPQSENLLARYRREMARQEIAAQLSEWRLERATQRFDYASGETIARGRAARIAGKYRLLIAAVRMPLIVVAGISIYLGVEAELNPPPGSGSSEGGSH